MIRRLLHLLRILVEYRDAIVIIVSLGCAIIGYGIVQQADEGAGARAAYEARR